MEMPELRNRSLAWIGPEVAQVPFWKAGRGPHLLGQVRRQPANDREGASGLELLDRHVDCVWT